MNKRIITLLVGMVFVITVLLFNIEETLKLQMILIIVVFTIIFAYGIDYKRYQKVKKTEPTEYKKDTKSTTQYKECNICHTKNKISNTFCYKCQSSLESIKCPVCEHINSFDHKFCSECNSILQNKRRH